ncbi:TonB-dependent receptor [Myroides odoratus]|uniref:Outer membrane cobalamin receptor protein n=1 Tax=Myroides odoratus TaxID=256 RepID=A0A378RQT4_MYROD|nr:TonB-dependent receptor [Myroides odoratus]QQU03976.1 TonB-dependent receptor [Myroides odoratus]STZ28641.1 Outer membrane cobalamin receptor protein [Myroides odoratus]
MHSMNKRFTFMKANLIIFFFCFTTIVLAQNSVEVQVTVTDEQQQGIAEVTVSIKNNLHNYIGLTDEKGIAYFQVVPDQYQIQYFHIGYQSQQYTKDLRAKQMIGVVLTPLVKELQEVIITAEEGKGLSSTSVINRKAMEHLQPSSFADLMELLPGGLAKTPNLTKTNVIRIREFGPSISGYATSALGVQFVMDGNVLNSNMDMLQAVKDNQSGASSRSTNGYGMDMRMLSTNDIESVEIIRGIPTVSYGDLTSGLVLIHRKSGYTKWQARVKADEFSKSYYIAKGFTVTPTWSLNASLDYLDALSDPRDVYETYKRVNGSIRSKKTFEWFGNTVEWRSNLDYSINIDDVKVDPDTDYLATDSYQNRRQKISFSNNFYYKFQPGGLFKHMKLTTNVNQGIEDIKQSVFVQYNGPTSVSIATEEGVNDGFFPDLSFVSHTKTEGRPLNINGKLETALEFQSGILKHNLELGVDYKYSHNYGRGEMYDLLTPPSTKSSTRPRAYKDIPAYQNIAFFAGDRVSWSLGENNFGLYGGLRVSKMLGLNHNFDLSKKVYFEPRFMLQWGLPKLALGEHILKADVTLGYGELYKLPTGLMLYPDKTYNDFTQLNFKPENTAYQAVNYMTYVDDLTNYQLVAAKNTKKEIRLDLSYAKHEFFINYFDEKMPNGFRSVSEYKTYSYKRYDTSGIDLEHLTEKPKIENLPYEERKVLQGNGRRENGSSTYKRGIEFGYASPRFEGINTRFTLSGAWFETLYTNTIPVQEKPSTSLAGKDYALIGIYKNADGNKISGMNYNLVVDTYLPALDMNISASFQGVLFKDDTREWKQDQPMSYFGVDGVIHEFTDADRKDAYLQWLVRNVSSTDNLNRHYTFDLQVNLKVSKRIYKEIKASLFVNKLYAYMSPYTFNKTKIYRKNTTNPYFGMELTYNF